MVKVTIEQDGGQIVVFEAENFEVQEVRGLDTIVNYKGVVTDLVPNGNYATVIKLSSGCPSFAEYNPGDTGGVIEI